MDRSSPSLAASPYHLLQVDPILVRASVTVPPEPTAHDCHELLYIQRGTYRSEVDSRRLEAGCGDWVLYPAGTLHRPVLERDGSLQMILLQWTGPCPIEHTQVGRDTDGRVLLLIQWLLEAARRGGAAGDQRRDLLLPLLLCALEDAVAPSHPVDGTLAELVHYLLDHQHLGVTLADCCHLTGLKPSRLCQRFRAAYGMPPLAYLQSLRIASARRLLQNTRLPVAEVARRVGLRSPSYLSRLMRRATGSSPRQLRRAATEQSG